MGDELVPLCSCWDLAEAQAIRASLEARGVPTLIDGEHQRGVMGVFGAAVDLRIMVPRSQLRLAHGLASEIISGLPPLPEEDQDEPDSELEPPPHRRALPEDLVAYRDDEEGRDEPADDEDDEDDTGSQLRRRSVGVPIVLGVFGLTLGLGHIYAGRRNIGLGLLLVAGVSIIAYWSGSSFAPAVTVAVWLVDLVGSVLLISRQNRELAPQARAAGELPREPSADELG